MKSNRKQNLSKGIYMFLSLIQNRVLGGWLNLLFLLLPYSALLVSGVEFSDSSLTYNTQCSSQQMPS